MSTSDIQQIIDVLSCSQSSEFGSWQADNELLQNSFQEFVSNVQVLADMLDSGDIIIDANGHLQQVGQNNLVSRWFFDGFNGEWYLGNNTCQYIVGSALLGACGFGAGLVMAIVAGWVSTVAVASGLLLIQALLVAMAPWLFTALTYIVARVGVVAINLVEALCYGRGVAIRYTMWGAVPHGSYVR